MLTAIPNKLGGIKDAVGSDVEIAPLITEKKCSVEPYKFIFEFSEF
jgi:hypothetical protein